VIEAREGASLSWPFLPFTNDSYGIPEATMTDEIKQAVPEELPWQRELREVRQLLRNVVVNHDRIRDRVRSLHDHFDEGNINTGISNWEEWASDYFAYSPTFLKYISSPHPLSLDEWEKKIAKTQEIEIEIQKKQDAARAQTAWDEWVQYEKEQAAQRKLESDKEIAEKKIEAARVKVAADIEAARIKADGEKEVARIRTKATRQKQKQSAKSKPQPDLTTVPPVEAAQAHLNNCIQIERKSRIHSGGLRSFEYVLHGLMITLRAAGIAFALSARGSSELGAAILPTATLASWLLPGAVLIAVFHAALFLLPVCRARCAVGPVS